MKTRSTILSIAALATLSLSALAPTQALAWGHGYGHHFGGYGHHGYGHRWGGYGHRSYGHRWGYGHRFYRWGGYRSYGGYGYGGYSYAPRSYGSYEVEPVEVPVPVIKRVFVPVEVPVPVRVPVREEACGCETSYAPPPPPVEESCNCEGPTRTYAPMRAPMRETFAPRPRRLQDNQDYASGELEKN